MDPFKSETKIIVRKFFTLNWSIMKLLLIFFKIRRWTDKRKYYNFATIIFCEIQKPNHGLNILFKKNLFKITKIYMLSPKIYVVIKTFYISRKFAFLSFFILALFWDLTTSLSPVEMDNFSLINCEHQCKGTFSQLLRPDLLRSLGWGGKGRVYGTWSWEFFHN